jgi:hypothetical protein
MLMAGSLSNKKRREEIRAALARGDLERVLRRKHEAASDDEATTLIRRPATPRENGAVPDNEDASAFPIPRPWRSKTVMQAPAPAALSPPPFPATAPAAPDADSYRHSQVLAIDSNYQKNELDQALFDAIRDGNMQRAIDAITRGADVNSRYTHFPSHKRGDCIIFGNTTPLEYAHKKGRQDFVEMLKRYGAKG